VIAPPTVLKIHELAAEPRLIHGFSTSAIGSVGLTYAPDPNPVLDSRRLLARELGVEFDHVTAAGAVHSSQVGRVDEPKEVVRGVDALITNRPGVALFATFADCYPIVLWDREKECVALVHAGWRGTLAGVVTAAVRALTAEYGCTQAGIRAGIGPGICGRCYEVGVEVASMFEPRFVTAGPGDRLLLDLAAANRAQLEVEGVREIFDLGLCTKETAYLPSHRRNPDGTRFGAIVAIRAVR
jgi:YfiH family protein